MHIFLCFCTKRWQQCNQAVYQPPLKTEGGTTNYQVLGQSSARGAGEWNAALQKQETCKAKTKAVKMSGAE